MHPRDRAAIPGHPIGRSGRTQSIPPLAAAFIACGAGLRIVQFAAHRSLFLDEVALALNVRERSPIELLTPLSHAQTAPAGYLLFLKLIATVLGTSEYVLRSPALLASVASLFLFFFVSRRILPAWLTTAAVALLAFSHYPIYWSADLKPYAIDLMAGLLLLLLTFRLEEEPGGQRAVALSAAGAILPYFSHASLLVMVAVATRLALTRPGGIGAVLRLTAWWVLALPAVQHAAGSLDPATVAYMHAFWREGFLLPPWTSGAGARAVAVLARTFYDPMGFGWRWPALAALTATLAGIARIRTHSAPLLLVVMPVLAAALASLAGLYPISAPWSYSGRLALFLVPSVYLLLLAGCNLLKPRLLAIGAACLLTSLVAIPSLAGLPYTRGESRDALDYVAMNARPADVIYIYYGVRLTTEWYRPSFPGRVVLGRCAQDDRTDYIRQLEALRGSRRVWIVLGYDFYYEQSLLIDYMDRNATLLDAAPVRLAEARLYDFGGTIHSPVAPDLMEAPRPPEPGTACLGIFVPDNPVPDRAQSGANRQPLMLP